MTKMELLEQNWERHEGLNERYNKAKENGDEKGMDACRKEYQELLQEVRAKGQEFSNMMRLYSEMKKRGNSRIDLSDTCQEPEKIIAAFKEFGVTEFTFSSTWTNATETAWAFTKLGCRLCGMTEINSQYQDSMSDEYEKAPAFLFNL